MGGYAALLVWFKLADVYQYLRNVSSMNPGSVWPPPNIGSSPKEPMENPGSATWTSRPSSSRHLSKISYLMASVIA
jgi:hypothetical protein